MKDPVTKFVRDNSGATAIEYSLFAALAAVAAVVGLESLGVSLEKLFSFAATTAIILLLTGSLALAAFLYAQTHATECRWRRLSAKDRPPLKRWVCRQCGEEAYSEDKWWPPKECKSAPQSVT